jgi:putative sugar O-methyltransferase
MLEVFSLVKLPRAPNKVVEIGAGACDNAALMIGAYNCEYTIVDLPETIPVGFAFLKAVFPSLRIALPNVVQEHINMGIEFEALWERFDVIFLLAYQSDVIESESMECAFNISSFQEMRIEGVNEYISLLRRVVKKGGCLMLENLKVSREIPGNSFIRYDMNCSSVKGCAYRPMATGSSAVSQDSSTFFTKGKNYEYNTL